jgi:hypothetical protein
MAKRKGAKETEERKAERPNAAPPEAEAAPQAAYRLGDAEAFGRNMARVAAQSQQLLSEFLRRQSERLGQEPFDPLNVSGAYFSLFKQMAANPGQMLKAQLTLWADYLTLLQRTTNRAFGGTVTPMAAPAAGDRRFRDKDWQENQIFDFIKQPAPDGNWLQKPWPASTGWTRGRRPRRLLRRYPPMPCRRRISRDQSRSAARDLAQQWRNPVCGSTIFWWIWNAATASYPFVRPRTFPCRARYRDNPRQGDVSQRIVRAPPIHPDDQTGL